MSATTLSTFKHALVQDAAYRSLLRSKRQQWHAQIACVIEERFPVIANKQPELLAHHFTQAGLAEQAVAYWQRSGELAIGLWSILGDEVRQRPGPRQR